MENTGQSTIFKFGIDDATRQNFSELAQWAKVNAILAFVSMGMSLLTIIVASMKFFDSLDAYTAGTLVGGMIGKQLVVWIISLVLNIILHNAGKNIQRALVNNDQRVFNIGLNQLARYFKIIGIIFIVSITLVLLIFIIAVTVTIFNG